jgi:hypothetical protein
MGSSEWMLVLIVGIGCAAGVLKTGIGAVQTYLDRKLKIEELRAQNNEAALQEALRHAQAEMAQLRQSTTDVILSFDSTLQRLDDRLQNVERLALKSAVTAGALPSASAASERPAVADVGAKGVFAGE